VEHHENAGAPAQTDHRFVNPAQIKTRCGGRNVARQSRNQIVLDCGGKQSATPLWKLGHSRKAVSPLRFATALQNNPRGPTDHTVYVLDAVVPPWPVQLVWKNWPRGWSTRS
jgi:hypothetical protein